MSIVIAIGSDLTIIANVLKYFGLILPLEMVVNNMSLVYENFDNVKRDDAKNKLLGVIPFTLENSKIFSLLIWTETSLREPDSFSPALSGLIEVTFSISASLSSKNSLDFRYFSLPSSSFSSKIKSNPELTSSASLMSSYSSNSSLMNRLTEVPSNKM